MTDYRVEKISKSKYAIWETKHNSNNDFTTTTMKIVYGKQPPVRRKCANNCGGSCNT